MAFQPKQNSTKKGSVIIVPYKNLVYVGTKRETGKTSFGFTVAEGEETFFCTGSLVSVNKDKTGFRVYLPAGDLTVYRSVKNANGEYERQALSVEKVEDLGYPVEE